MYNYEAETMNGVNGATKEKSGPKISCKVSFIVPNVIRNCLVSLNRSHIKSQTSSAAQVEVDVPQTCSFILRTSECSLKEISGVDDNGNPIYRSAAGAKAFKEAMAK